MCRESRYLINVLNLEACRMNSIFSANKTSLFRDCVLVVLIGAGSLLMAMPVANAAAGYALEFDGADDYVETPLSDVPANGAVEAWVKTTSNVRQAVFSSHGGEEFRLHLNYRPGTGGDSPGVLGLNVRYGTLRAYADIGSSIYDGAWHHVAFVWEGGSPGTIMVYWDGQKKVITYGPQGDWEGNYNRSVVHVIGRECLNNNNYFFNGLIDEVRFWDQARSVSDVQEYMNRELLGDEGGLVGYWKFNEGQGAMAHDSSPNGNHGTLVGASWTPEAAPVAAAQYSVASSPIPPDGAADVPPDVVLGWTPGGFANTHDVYWGTVFDDVNNAGRTDPLGVLVSQNQAPNSYSPAEVPQWGQEYYWRIDEVNAPPDNTVYKGDVWSFTVEPIAYPVENLTAAASSFSEGGGPVNTTNGSGLDANDLHSTDSETMWLSSTGGPQPAWIQYEFDRVYKLHQMWVWNCNVEFEGILGFGVKEATVEYSLDGVNWDALDTTHEFSRAPGAPGYAHDTTIDFHGEVARYVRITAMSNWGGTLQYGLSEVRFLYIPVWAREQSPASGTTDVGVANVTLHWRAGREAAQHNVYFSTHPQQVMEETVTPVSLPADSSYTSYDTGELELGKTYYWKVNEVNEAEMSTVWQGDVWDFDTQEYLVVDNFEDYNDWEPYRIFDTWIDGWDVPANGSLVGYETFPFAEQSIVHDGKQSMPFMYDNGSADYSEAGVDVAHLTIGRDWTRYGIGVLRLYFHGDPNNSPTEQMYAKLNGSKVTYDGPSDNLRQTVWRPWDIDLALFGADLKNVATLSVGFERSGTVGGQGVVYFDDIRLYPHPEQDTPPVTPPGAGYALEFDGTDDYVETPLSDVPANGTVEAWIKSASEARQAVLSSHGGDQEFRLHLNYQPGKGGSSPGMLGLNVRFRTLTGYADVGSEMYDGAWHHVAFAWEGEDPGTIRAYWDGRETPVTYRQQNAWAGNYERTVVHVIGRECLTNNNYFFGGLIDEVRFWEKARSAVEIQEHMSRVLLGDEEGLVGSWEFNEGGGTTAYDSSPNGYDAMVTGAAWTTDAAPVAP